eukprot:NODE_36_length_36011_cov_1.012920.p27 type:complete len:108 gc:universal NODE_36_length_36011_cov_1.012920:31142-31465(+)
MTTRKSMHRKLLIVHRKLQKKRKMLSLKKLLTHMSGQLAKESIQTSQLSVNRLLTNSLMLKKICSQKLNKLKTLQLVLLKRQRKTLDKPLKRLKRKQTKRLDYSLNK